MLFYFSGTGNSRWVAQELGRRLCDEVRSLADYPQDGQEIEAGETLGIVFPVYAWGIPSVVSQWLDAVRFSSKPAYVYFVCTCGDDTGKTAELVERALSAKGLVCYAGFSVQMPNTYVCLPGFDVDSADIANQKLHDAEARVQQIARQVAERKSVFDCHEGSIPWIKSYVFRPFFNRFLMSPRLFHATDACISCGKCVEACPLHNVRLEEGRPAWGTHCTMCLSCYHHCPKHAVAYGSRTKGKGQYKLKIEN